MIEVKRPARGSLDTHAVPAASGGTADRRHRFPALGRAQSVWGHGHGIITAPTLPPADPDRLRDRPARRQAAASAAAPIAPRGAMQGRKADAGAVQPYRGADVYNENHNLIHEFPEHRERIHALKTGNQHFARLFEEYHEIDREIRRIETEVEPAADDYLESLKKRRVHLKDELYAMLQTAA